MSLRRVSRQSIRSAAGLVVAALVGCSQQPVTPPTSPTPVPTVAPAPTPTPTPVGIYLPAGMVCDPTPPPVLRMHLKVHSTDGGRVVLDSKPLVVNVDNYCTRIGIGNWQFCDTRPEGDPQRTACDFLAVGQASDTGRWGPTWRGEGKDCGAEFSNCANHPSNQFMAIARDHGVFEACVSNLARVAPNGVRCGVLEYY